MSVQSAYSKLYEDVLEAFKRKIEELSTGQDKILDKVIEGEEEMGDSNNVCMVVGGPDNIVVSGTRSFEHRIIIYASYMSRDINEPGILKRLRNIAGKGYDKIMQDIHLGGAVLVVVPRRIEPGFVVFGEQIYVGVLQTWEARKLQGFEVPSG